MVCVDMVQVLKIYHTLLDSYKPHSEDFDEFTFVLQPQPAAITWQEAPRYDVPRCHAPRYHALPGIIRGGFDLLAASIDDDIGYVLLLAAWNGAECHFSRPRPHFNNSCTPAATLGSCNRPEGTRCL